MIDQVRVIAGGPILTSRGFPVVRTLGTLNEQFSSLESISLGFEANCQSPREQNEEHEGHSA